MKLEIVIPALNEEQSIRSIIERSLAARAHIVNGSPVEEVGITVVSDGSTDHTVEYAREYEDRIDLIVFEENRGYGAAIMEGWRRSDADLLSFLDADGTCDPAFFATLCTLIGREDADVVLGCRMTDESRMPLTRRVGNRIFASILTLFSFERVRDSASGMRVVRRAALDKLMPLPTGLHFTPAMSARALFSRDLKIVETDMSYQEREGESKLHPIRDGFRFLRVILEMAFLHRPSRPLGVAALLLLAVSSAMMIQPILHRLQHGDVQEWMIYRFVVSELLGAVGILLMCAGYIGRKAVDISLSDRPAFDKHHGLLGNLVAPVWFWLLPIVLVAIGSGLVADAFVDFVRTGHVYEHWSRFITMSFCLLTAAILAVTKIVDACLNLLADHLQSRLDAACSSDATPGEATS